MQSHVFLKLLFGGVEEDIILDKTVIGIAVSQYGRCNFSNFCHLSCKLLRPKT